MEWTKRKIGWQGHQISFQTAAQIAGALSKTPSEYATQAAIANQNHTVQQIRRVPFILRVGQVIGGFIYFIPTAIARTVKLVINQTKTLTLKVFGGG